MELSSRNDFNLIAIPSQAQALRLANLAAADSGAFNNAFSRERAETRRLKEKRDDEMTAALMELTLAVYRETQARILRAIEIDDAAARLALKDIDREAARNARDRQEMIDQAVKLDDGTAVFLDRDGRKLFTEHGELLSGEQTQSLLAKRRAELEARRRWEDMEDNRRERMALDAEREDVHRHIERGEQFREDVESGDLTQDEMEDREREHHEAAPERVKRFRPEAEAEYVHRPRGNDLSAPAGSHSAGPSLAHFNDVAAGTDLETTPGDVELPPELDMPQRSAVAPMLGR